MANSLGGDHRPFEGNATTSSRVRSTHAMEHGSSTISKCCRSLDASGEAREPREDQVVELHQRKK